MASILRLCFSLIAYLMIIQFCVGSSNSPKKVSLDLYYESLCPGSSKFIANDLHTIYKNGLIEVVDLRFFPWGNAIINSDGSFTCQVCYILIYKHFSLVIDVLSIYCMYFLISAWSYWMLTEHCWSLRHWYISYGKLSRFLTFFSVCMAWIVEVHSSTRCLLFWVVLFRYLKLWVNEFFDRMTVSCLFNVLRIWFMRVTLPIGKLASSCTIWIQNLSLIVTRLYMEKG